MKTSPDRPEQENHREPVRKPRRLRYVSERGPFEISANPTINPPRQAEEIDDDYGARAFECSELAEKCGEAPVRQKMIEMVRTLWPGIASTRLFGQEDSPNGMVLVHVWFGPHYPLFRHSHPKAGDCLYYVVAGEIILGRRKLRAGSVMFLPSGMPYKFKAGPAGVEVLEFRAGGGDPNAPGLKLEEHSLDSVQQLIDEGKAHQHEWQVPERIGDTALRQAEVDAKAD